MVGQNNMEELPQVPAGAGASVWSTIMQSREFHSSADSFLSSHGDANLTAKGGVRAVRAKILNRDVIIVSSYNHCQEILAPCDDEDSVPLARRYVMAAQPDQTLQDADFVVLPAYKELMVDFFPMPNLLLTDAEGGHQALRLRWDAHMAKVCCDSSATVQKIAAEDISALPDGTDVDLYKWMKNLSWKMLVSLFLNMKSSDKDYADVVKWQEQLLRGQFSLFPVSISTPVWRSARTRGLDARGKIQELLNKTFATPHEGCPFQQGHKQSLSPEELASNALLFTSSIAVKALASLLTASVLNLYCFPGERPLASQLRDLAAEPREKMLQSILLETERLSPPVIGVMRRVRKDVVLQHSDAAQSPRRLIPRGWDAWLYFVGAARDESVYAQAAKFIPERFMIPEKQPRPSLTFGFGGKTCLGRDITRHIVLSVATTMLDSGIDLHGSVDDSGVQAWLGWNDSIPAEAIARDIKQLPCQRPRRPIKLRVQRAGGRPPI